MGGTPKIVMPFQTQPKRIPSQIDTHLGGFKLCCFQLRILVRCGGLFGSMAWFDNMFIRNKQVQMVLIPLLIVFH